MPTPKTFVANKPDIRALLKGFKDVAVTVAADEINKYAEKEAHDFRERIRNQGFESFVKIPLSWRTLARRRQADVWSTDTLVVRGRYVNSIKVYRRNKRSGAEFLIGIHQNTMQHDLVTGRSRGFRMVDVARVNELGSSNGHIPARPHWWPFFMEMANTRAPEAARKIRRELVKAWKAKHGGWK